MHPVKTSIRWLVFFVAQGDTNEDGEVDYDDGYELGITKVNGRHYTPLIDNFDTVYGMDLCDDTTLIVMYQSDQRNLVSKIDLNQPAVIEMKKLSKIPTE